MRHPVVPDFDLELAAFDQAFGMTVGSCSVRLHRARAPLTSIERTVIPTRSRLKLHNDLVALALIPATPSSTSVAGS